MRQRTHPTNFLPGDRVAPLYEKPNEVHGTFVGYCRGYISHCIVQWDGTNPECRVNAAALRLIRRDTSNV